MKSDLPCDRTDQDREGEPSRDPVARDAAQIGMFGVPIFPLLLATGTRKYSAISRRPEVSVGSVNLTALSHFRW